MTEPHPIIRQRAPAGWLAVSGSLPRLGGEYPQMAARLLEKIDLGAQVLIVTPPEVDPVLVKRFGEDIEALLGLYPAIHILRQDVQLDLRGVGFLVLTGGDVESWFFALSREILEKRMQAHLANGGVLLASDASCASLGSWRFRPGFPDPVAGLGWLPGGLILPGIADPGELQAVRALLLEQEHSYALGLPSGTALAVGAAGEMEVWSRNPPKVILGQGWNAP
jgi:hypothetical protein